MADSLEALKADIGALGEQVKQLKSAPDSYKDVVATAVKQLVDAKKKYAELNNGIGVDGKPFVEQLSKADKKKAAKEQKGSAETGEASKQVRCWDNEMMDIHQIVYL